MDSLAIFKEIMINPEQSITELIGGGGHPCAAMIKYYWVRKWLVLIMGRHPCAEMIKNAFKRLRDDVEDWRNAEENQDTFCDDFWTDYDDNNREGMGFWTIIYLMDGEIQFLNFDAHRDTGDFDMSWDRVQFETIYLIHRDHLGNRIN